MGRSAEANLRAMVGSLARRKGRMAEERVKNMAESMGLSVESGPDYHGKVDLIIRRGDGWPILVQVSVGPKSKRTGRGLKKRGIVPIVAGPEVSDARLREQLEQLIELLG